jgi:hypothetical protein
MPVTISGTSGITTPGAALSSGSITFPDSSTLPSATFSPVYPVTASVAANAMTVTLNPCSLAFRSSTLTSGTTVTRTVAAAISVTVSSGSTLGTVSAQQSRIIVLAIDNAGTVELAVVNISGGTQLDETNLISTTAEGGAGAADSATVVYSTTARSNVAYRVVGFIQSTQSTAGTWATAPSTIQGYGGQALSAMSSIGYGQTWQLVTGSRAFGTTYYNTTGKPIQISVTGQGTVNASSTQISVTVNGVQAGYSGTVLGAGGAVLGTYISVIVPPGASYVVTNVSQASLAHWSELR